MLRLIFSAVSLFLLMVPAQAQMSAQKRALVESLQMQELIIIMRDEGLSYGEILDTDLLADSGGEKWAAQVSEIYDTMRMQEDFIRRFDREMPEHLVAPVLAFFDSPRGRRIINLEVTARRAQLDEAVEEASLEYLRDMIGDGDPRLELLRRFAEINELIETNVVGAMNANYAFYIGLVEGGAFPYELTEEQILSDVWGQEDDIRMETKEWLYSYLAMAYQPLEDADIEAYIVLSATDAGQALNRALFSGFDAMFVSISKSLGYSAAQLIGGEDI